METSQAGVPDNEHAGLHLVDGSPGCYDSRACPACMACFNRHRHYTVAEKCCRLLLETSKVPPSTPSGLESHTSLRKPYSSRSSQLCLTSSAAESLSFLHCCSSPSDPSCVRVAPDFATFLAGRSVQGVGGGGIITLAQVIFADIISLRQRPKYFSAVLLAWALGSVLGPLVGALFVQKSTWRWCFWVNLPFCGIGLITVPLFVRLKTETSRFKEKLTLVDWTGGFLFISGLTSFLIGLSWAGVQFEWTSFRTLVPLIVGAATLFICIIWERFGSRQPFLTKSLFREWSAIAAYLSALFQGLIVTLPIIFCWTSKANQNFQLFMSLYYFPFYFMVSGPSKSVSRSARLRLLLITTNEDRQKQAAPLKSPIAAGVLLFPATCFMLPGSAVVSQLITRFGHFR